MIKQVLRWMLAGLIVVSGVLHFVATDVYLAMVPAGLPAPRGLVLVSGVAEMLGGLGLLVPRTRRLAGWWVVALLVAVFPANVNMAINDVPLAGRDLPAWALWARLPLQAVLIAWAWWMTRPDRPPEPAR